MKETLATCRSEGITQGAESPRAKTVYYNRPRWSSTRRALASRDNVTGNIKWLISKT